MARSVYVRARSETAGLWNWELAQLTRLAVDKAANLAQPSPPCGIPGQRRG